jgi:hypothetical protein
VLDDIRGYAREQLDVLGRTRAEYIRIVVAYAREKHGDGEDVKRNAERTARYIWDSRPNG